jgi:hypothetical protein
MDFELRPYSADIFIHLVKKLTYLSGKERVDIF